ncbi:hypothetical protein [Magnetospirillum moscoviense]|uniref:Flagellar protein FliL n=1 Tax=Magnetospirillum moscoviense TaxID=1437059 RepID=A0A178MX47_9PROT|nr:hypothetical protein [Magnetospirillum moscoviense]OAN55380.1 hypothetical protein A6A05_08315 [Magnetospirillum moscoviense]
MRRRLLMAACLMAPCLPALAAGSGAKPRETYVKLQSVNLEFWDQDGLFHMVILELTAVYPLEVKDAKLDKKVAEKVTHAMASMAWEEFNRGNPAATAKAITLDIIRKEPGGDKCIDVLINRLVIR